MKEKNGISKIIFSKWLYLAMVIAVACAIWATDFSSVADVSTCEIVNDNVVSTSQMHDSSSPHDRIDDEILMIEPGVGDKVFLGSMDLSEGDVLMIRFTAVNHHDKKATLTLNLFADGYDNPYNEITVTIKPGEEDVCESIEYYRDDHPNQCDIRLFTSDDTSLEIRGFEIDQAVIDKQGNSTLKTIAEVMRMIAIAAFIFVFLLTFLKIRSRITIQEIQAGHLKNEKIKGTLLYFGEILAVTVLLTIIYRRADISLPLTYLGGDEMGVYYYSKMIDQFGLSLVNQFTGGQTGADMFDYPYSDKLSFASIRALGLVTNNPYIITNLFYFMNYYLVAVISTAVARALGVSRVNSFVIGMLFAFSPYMQIRYGVRGKMNLPSCGKEFFPHTVSRFFFAQ